LIVALFLVACGKKVEIIEPPFVFDDNLLQIDSLMQHDADSALQTLLSFRAERGFSSEFNDNYHSLLLSEAFYKTYNPQLNRYCSETFQETSLQDAMRYFDSLAFRYPDNDDITMLSARAHYMNGVGFYENDSIVEACKEYLHTLEIMEDHFDEKDLVGYKAKFMGLSCTRLGEVFYNNDIAKASLYFYKNALKHYYVVDNYSLAYPYRNVGSAYYLDHQNDSALFYYRKAWHSAKNQNKIAAYCVSLSESVSIYYDLGQVDSAYMIIKDALHLPCSDDTRLAQYYTLGFLYAKEKCYDSAIIYLEQSIKRNSYSTQTASAELLMNCYQALGDTVKTDYYKSIYGNNFGKYRNNAEIAIELTRLYDDYQQKRLDKEILLIRKHQKRVYFIVFSIVIILIAVISAIVHKTVIKSNKALAEKDRALEDMKRKIKANPFMKEPICKSILAVVNNNNFKAKVDYRIYQKNALDKQQLMALRDAVDRHYHNFTQTLVKLHPELTVDDIDYCCLYLLGLKDADISALIQRAYPTVHQRSIKLKHIFNTKESLQSTIAAKAAQSYTKP